jgi:hypothetical protein
MNRNNKKLFSKQTIIKNVFTHLKSSKGLIKIVFDMIVRESANSLLTLNIDLYSPLTRVIHTTVTQNQP